jgi:hypothetical protein
LFGPIGEEKEMEDCHFTVIVVPEGVTISEVLKLCHLPVLVSCSENNLFYSDI